MRILRGILLSLLVHAFLIWSAQFAPLIAPQAQHENITIEIQENPSQNKTKQIVRDSIVPEKLKVHESEDPLSFLSRETQRVKKQTRAILNGLTKNRSPEKAQANKERDFEGQNTD
jgi:stress response protein YsnF